MAVISLVKEAIFLCSFAFLLYRILPVSSQITTAAGEEISTAKVVENEKNINKFKIINFNLPRNIIFIQIKKYSLYILK